MPPKKKTELRSYTHADQKRANNPPVGLVSDATDPLNGQTEYQHDPHIDPRLSWAGKAEGQKVNAQNVSLHIHERIDAASIAESFLKRNERSEQQSMFHDDLPLGQAVDFYRHEQNWSNRLIAGDSLLVMNSLLVKEGMAGKVQMVYVDPPYGIKYNSNFQPFVNKINVRDGDDKDLPAEPETIQAFRDTWEIGVHSYLTHLRDRLLLARKLLTDSGSVFVQIGDENVHRVGLILDDVFGASNRIATITFATTTGSTAATLPQAADYILWYAKDAERLKRDKKYCQLYEPLTRAEVIKAFSSYVGIEAPNGETRKLTAEERFDPDKNLPKGARIYKRVRLDSQGISTTGRSEPYEWNGRVFHCAANRQWSVSEAGLDRLAELGRLEALPGQTSLMWKQYEDEYPGRRINNIWPTRMPPFAKRYVVETSPKPIERCMLMATAPGDLVFDPTCGSGTTAFVAERWGRRWITCDTSRVAVTLAKQLLLTSHFDYYKLNDPDAGVKGGFDCKRFPYVSAALLAYNRKAEDITLHDQPKIDKSKVRVAGPFTVEAVPSLRVRPFGDAARIRLNGAAAARSGATERQAEWRGELSASGIRAIGGRVISFSRVEIIKGLHYLHARAFARGDNGATQMAYISFGPDYGPLEPRQVELAMREALELRERPDLVIFAAFHFDPEAAKDIGAARLKGATVLQAQMSADLLTADLRKKRASNQSYWLVGQPQVEIERLPDGDYQATVRGFDYYDPGNGKIISGDAKKIAMWLLDSDYDDRSVVPSQVFFPNASKKRGWDELAKALKAAVDADALAKFSGVQSAPFKAGKHKRVAVKIVDMRGIESLVIKELR